jgi:type III pantothenate kinase
MQKVVAVDIGNSAIKLAVSAGAPVVRIGSGLDEVSRAAALAEAVTELEEPVQWLVCSVDKEESDWLEAQVSKLRPSDDFRLITESDIELPSCVEDRKALGRDRLLASWYAAIQNGAESNSIVVDGGTAVTIDVVSNRCHQGGLIFPGSHTCLAALSAQTDALPDLTQTPAPSLSTEVQLGTSTEPAILFGVHQLQLFGIVAMVRSLQQQYTDSSVVCCGGMFESVQQLLPTEWNYKRDFLTEAIFELKSHL